MNFTTAASEIQNLTSKRNQIIKKAGGIIAEAIKDRSASGRLDNRTKGEVLNMIKEFSDEEKAEILVEALVIIGGLSSTTNGGSRRSGSIF